MTIVFRDAVGEDAPLLSRLGRDTFVETFGHLYRREDLDAFLAGHSVEAWRQILADPAFHVRLVEDDGLPAGFARVGPVSLPVETSRPAMEIRQFYLARPWQGAGLAPRLMDWALGIARAKGAGHVYLSVFSENHRARRFYERYGFRFVKPYAFMVGDQADEDHILVLELEENGA